MTQSAIELLRADGETHRLDYIYPREFAEMNDALAQWFEYFGKLVDKVFEIVLGSFFLHHGITLPADPPPLRTRNKDRVDGLSTLMLNVEPS